MAVLLLLLFLSLNGTNFSNEGRAPFSNELTLTLYRHPIRAVYEAHSLFVVSKLAKGCDFRRPHSGKGFDIRLVIHEDGNFELQNTRSGETLWEISTNDPLSSQSDLYIPDNPEYYLFPGQHARLYVLTINKNYERHPLSVDQYVHTTPEIKGTAVVLGSKLSTEYVVDACSGNLIHKLVPANVTTFSFSTTVDHSPSLSHQYAYIMVIRTDYTIISSNFTKVEWNWSYALFTAYYLSNYACVVNPPIIPIRFQGNGHILAWIANKESFSTENFNKSDSASTDGTRHKRTDVKSYNIHCRRIVTTLCILVSLAFFCILLREEIKEETKSLFCKLLIGARKGKTENTMVSASQGGSRKKKRYRNVKKCKVSGNMFVPTCEIGKGEVSGNMFVPTCEIGKGEVSGNMFVPTCEIGKGEVTGDLFVSTCEIGKSINGTIVVEGTLDGRPIAIKQLLHADYALPLLKNTISDLIKSDAHPNIARFYGYKSDSDFIYILIERCSTSLFGMVDTKDERLWTDDGYPSPQLLKLLRDVISGLMYLHKLGIFHENLKPENVLISEGMVEGMLIAKLSDIGIIKRLKVDSSHATGSDKLEQSQSQSKAADVFNLGCLIFYSLSRGSHPFGDFPERDKNIKENKYDLFLIDYMPEALDILHRLLDKDPIMRPDVKELPSHPSLWDYEMRVSFLCDTSLRMKNANQTDIDNLERLGPVVFGKKWDQSMGLALVTNMKLHGQYRFNSLKDLLRAIRNQHAHYVDLPDEIKGILGSNPDGFAKYFAKKFPNLLIEIYRFVRSSFRNEELFKKYF